MESNGYRCETCNKGFGSLRELSIHRRSREHNLARGNDRLDALLKEFKPKW